ncbi:MAG: DNA polymerase III subunit delta [Candidatus Glassbacteria bacterium]
MNRKADLSYNEARREIRSGKLRHIYYIRGDEDYLKRELAESLIKSAIDERTKDFNYHPLETGELEAGDFASLLFTPPMMYGKRLLHIKDAQRMGVKLRDIAAEFARKPCPGVVLLMVDPRKLQEVPSSERTSKLLRSVSGRGGAVVTCWKLFGGDLLRWVKESFDQSGLTVTEETANFLIEAVGEDLMRLDSEVEKLSTYVSGRKSIRPEDIERVTGRYRRDTVFELMHLTSEGRLSESVQALKSLRRLGESPGRIIYWLMRHYMELGALVIEKTERERKACLERRGRRPRLIVDRYLAEAALHDEDSVRKSLAEIYDADVSIKRDGASPDTVIERLVVTLSTSLQSSLRGQQ